MNKNFFKFWVSFDFFYKQIITFGKRKQKNKITLFLFKVFVLIKKARFASAQFCDLIYKGFIVPIIVIFFQY